MLAPAQDAGQRQDQRAEGAAGPSVLGHFGQVELESGCSHQDKHAPGTCAAPQTRTPSHMHQVILNVIQAGWLNASQRHS